MANQTYATSTLQTDGTGLREGTMMQRLEFAAGPAAAATVVVAHGLAAGFEMFKIWIIHTGADGDVTMIVGHDSAVETVWIDGTNLNWKDTIDLSSDTGVGYIEYFIT